MSLFFFKPKTQLAVDFSFLAGTLDPKLSFTRASTGWRGAPSGLLEETPVNTARFDYDPTSLALAGLLIEGQGTNIQIYSKVGPNWPRDLVLTQDTTDLLSPEGQYTAAKLTESTSAVIQRTYRSAGQTVSSVDPYTFSVFFKAGTANIAQLSTGSGTSLTAFANFDLVNGVVTNQAGISGASIRPMANGWYRCAITIASIPDGTTPTFLIAHCANNPTAARQISYAGTGLTFYAWGAQIEKGTSVSTYIPTTTAVVTRAADQLSFTVPSDVTLLRYVFDDNSTQDVAVTAGTYTVPTALSRSRLKKIFNAN